MKVIVTTGPSYEPIDEVRRLTNSSTGELGVLLSNQLAGAAFEVICLKGIGATFPGPAENCAVRPFTTNDDLFQQLSSLSAAGDVGAVFQVAALCDFKVKSVVDEHGQKQESAKIESRAGALTVVLEPARKVIAATRDLFPKAVLVGWKYELAGDRSDALVRAWRQLKENRTDACVLNGKAYGSGFALCTLPNHIHDLRDKNEVAQFLPGWLHERLESAGRAR
jgi:phosphopantothenoylcysteine synthetase/decarboxylase